MADARTLESLEYNCGPLIMDALRDPSVIEIMLNPDGAVWIERYGQEQERVGELGLAQGRLILSLVARTSVMSWGTAPDRKALSGSSWPLASCRRSGVRQNIMSVSDMTIMPREDTYSPLATALAADAEHGPQKSAFRHGVQGWQPCLAFARRMGRRL